MPSYSIGAFGAVGDGTTNDAPAFASFNASAILDTGLVTLNLGSSLVYNFTTSTALNWAKNIPRLLVAGNGSTLKNATASQRFFLGGRGQFQDNAHHARVQTAEEGSTSVTLIDPSKASLFTVGRWALITGFDLQGIYGDSFGFPSNPHFFQYVKVTNISGAVITFDAPLTDSYLSTWPHFTNGTAFEIDQGGPATLYALDPSWDAEIEYQNLTIINDSFQTYSKARSVIYNGCTATGSFGPVPSENLYWEARDCDFSGCNMEVDKLIKEMVLSGSTVVDHVKVQSSSVDLLTISDTVSINDDLTGTAKRCNITTTGSFGTFAPGVYGYGSSHEVNIANTAITTFQTGGFNQNCTAMGLHMAGGIIYYRNGATVTGAADNGSGKVRLTVDNATDFVTGQAVNVSGIVGTTEANIGIDQSPQSTITAVDATHIDLPNISFVHAYVSGGIVGNRATLWAVPGSYCLFTGTSGGAGIKTIFKVLDVYQDADYTYIQTSMSGGFPSLPGSLGIRPHPAPVFTCRSCSGSALVLDLNQAPAGAPLYSYSKRTYTADAAGTTVKSKFDMWGAFSSAKFTVTDDYVGAGALTFSLSTFGNWPLLQTDLATTANFGPSINMKAGVGAPRTILASSTSGGQIGDTLVAPGVGVWFGGQSNSGPIFSANVSNGETPTIEVEITTDQGIVFDDEEPEPEPEPATTREVFWPLTRLKKRQGPDIGLICELQRQWAELREADTVNEKLAMLDAAKGTAQELAQEPISETARDAIKRLLLSPIEPPAVLTTAAAMDILAQIEDEEEELEAIIYAIA